MTLPRMQGLRGPAGRNPTDLYYSTFPPHFANRAIPGTEPMHFRRKKLIFLKKPIDFL